MLTQIGLAFLLFIIGSALSSTVAITIASIVSGQQPTGDAAAFMFAHPWPGVAVGMALQALVGFYGFKRLVRRREHREPFELQGPQAGREWLAGFGFGFGYITIVMLILMLLGVYKVTGASLTTGIVVGLMLGVGAAFLEEVVFRGFLLRLLDARYGSYVAIAITSVVFGGIHIVNGLQSGDSSLWGAVAIMVESGVLLGAAYYLTRRLWFVIGLHTAWNFALAGFYSVPVSNFSIGKGLLDATLAGPEWMTGGKFGPEASVITVVVGLLLGVWLLILARRRGNLKTN